MDGELCGYTGLVLPCPLGVDERPVNLRVAFEPCHVARYWPGWRYLDMVERDRRPRQPGRPQPWERNHGGRKLEGLAGTVGRVRSSRAIARALDQPKHWRHRDYIDGEALKKERGEK